MKTRITITMVALMLGISSVAQEEPQDKDYAYSGYRGFIEIGMGATPKRWEAIGDDIYNNGELKFERASIATFDITTTHGYQANEHIFVGGGLVTRLTEPNHIDYDDGCCNPFFRAYLIPFADVRLDLWGKKTSPYLDIRKGRDKYFAFTLGVHYKKMNIGAGFDTMWSNEIYDDWNMQHKCVGRVNSIMVKIAIDWGAR